MNLQEEKYVVAAQGEALNSLVNVHAESRANKELLILLAKKLLQFPPGESAEAFWQKCFDTAKGELSRQSQDKMKKALQ